MSLFIHAIETAVPEGRISQDDACQMSEELSDADERGRRLIRAVYRNSGIQSRSVVGSRETFATGEFGPGTRERMAIYAREAPALSLRACVRAMEISNTCANDIAHIITVSCTGFMAPGIDVHLARNLNIKANVGRTHIGFMGCPAALNALKVADGMAQLAPNSKVLICCVELCSLHFQHAAEFAIPNALFADGAAAVIVSAQPHAERSIGKIAAFESFLLPDSEDVLRWIIGDHGFEMSVTDELPNLIQHHVRPWMDNLLARRGMAISDVQSWAVHPGGPRVLTAVRDSLSLSEASLQTSRAVLSMQGNMSSPTVLFILNQLRAMPSWLPAVVLGFGPGLTMEVGLICDAH